MLESRLVPYEDEPKASAFPETSSPQDQQRVAHIKRWLTRIENSKKKFEKDFKRMRENSEFVAGMQWPGQTTIDSEEYVVPIALRMVNQKVATLYAKNPTAVADRRDSLDFALWDENVESLSEMMQQAEQFIATGQPLPPEISDFLEDVKQGRLYRKMVDRLAKTLKIVYQYQVDSHKPEFKEQLKQLVRRVIVCGVAFLRVTFCSGQADYAKVSFSEVGFTPNDRVKRIRGIMAEIEAEDLDESSAQFQTLRSLLFSLGASEQNNETTEVPERLEFDCPPPTSIIVDERCRHLKEFVNARWIAQEFTLPLEEINSIFGTKIQVGGGAGYATEAMPESTLVNSQPISDTSDDPMARKMVCLYNVFDKTTNTHFFICEGWEDYVLAPEPVIPKVAGFWHIHALTFNDVEAVEGSNTSIYPMSDVQAIKHAQMEWNRTRNALRHHRNANSPKYLTRKGYLSDNDKRALQECKPNGVVELEGVPIDQPINNFIVSFAHAPVDPTVYDVTPLEQDLLFGGGIQEANIGPAQPNVTASGANIAEQSRLTVSASNIDDLDGFLSRVAQCGGEMLLRAMSVETVQRIAKRGAVWPETAQAREDFVNEVNLKIEAASSGRPNKAMSISNFRDLAPMLQAAGANPVGMVEEAARRLDDNIDVSKFFPLMPTGVGAGAQSEEASLGDGGPPSPTSSLERGGIPTTPPLPQGVPAPF